MLFNLIAMRRILFIIPALKVGGTNSSLCSLLYELSKMSAGYDIDILPLTSQGEFADRFSSYNIIKPNWITDYWFGSFREIKGLRRIPALAVKIVKKIAACLHLEMSICKLMATRVSKYDVAIAYEEGNTTRFGAYVRATRHLAWIHCNLRYLNFNTAMLADAYRRMDRVVCVSESARDAFIELFPDCAQNSVVVYNLIDRKKILELSSKTYDDLDKIRDGRVILVSVGRLDPIKQFDLIPGLASKLRDNGRQFLWLIIGDGTWQYRRQIEDEIERWNVTDFVKLTRI